MVDLQKALGKNRRAMVKLRQELAQVTRLLRQVVGEMESDGYTFNEELTDRWEKAKKR